MQRALSGGAAADTVAHWEREVARLFKDEIQYHFAAEEQILFPAAEQHDSLQAVVAELRREHEVLRGHVSAAAGQRLGEAGLKTFAGTLTAHVRKEERDLFEACQQLFSTDQLQRIGKELDAFFRASGMPPQSCGLPFRAEEA